MNHTPSNPRPDRDIAAHLAGRVVPLRLAVETALHRIGMWQASHHLDPATNAEQVLEQVRRILADIPPPVCAPKTRR